MLIYIRLEHTSLHFSEYYLLNDKDLVSIALNSGVVFKITITLICRFCVMLSNAIVTWQ